MFQYSNVSLRQKLPNVKVHHYDTPLLMHWAKNISQNPLFDLLIDHLALWHKLTVDKKNTIKMTSAVLLSSYSVTSETSTHWSGTWFLGPTQKSMSRHQWFSTKQVWFSLKMLNDVLTHLYVMLLLIIIQ